MDCFVSRNDILLRILSLHSPDNSLLAIYFFDFFGNDGNRVTDSEILFPIDAFRADNFILMKKSFHSFYSNKESIVKLKLDISLICLSKYDIR